MRWTLSTTATTGIILACLAPLHADDAQTAFNDLYGARLREVSRTRSKADDVELAKQMLATADTASGAPQLLALLCEKSHELAMRDPSGYETAAAALTRWVEAQPDRAAELSLKMIDVRQRQYARARGEQRTEAGNVLVDLLVAHGDRLLAAKKTDDASDAYRRALLIARAIRSPLVTAVDARLDRLVHRKRILKRIESLEDQLDDDKADKAAIADEIVRLYVLELDDPAGAMLVLATAGNAMLRRNASLAAKAVDALTEKEAIGLAQWYHQQSNTVAAAAKPADLNRARAYFEQFLQLHTAEDVQHVAAKVRLKQVSTAMAKLGVEPYPLGGQPAVAANDTPHAGKIIDLLKLIDPAKHAVRGKWLLQDGHLRKDSRDVGGMIRLPVTPRGDYELAMGITHNDGGGHVSIALPVGDTAVTFFAAFQKDAVMATVDGKLPYQQDNPTRTEGGALVAGKKHKLLIKVRIKANQAQITIDRDGKPLLKWQGPLKSLALAQGAAHSLPEPNTLALGAHYATLRVDALQLRMLSGKAKMLK